MAEHAENAGHGEHDGDHPNYTRIYFILLGLLVVSIIGPEFGITWLTLTTAFGIALVKAALVVRNFMHLKWERSIIGWTLGVSLLLMFLMFAGIAPDVMNHEGRNWTNEAAQAAVERGIPTEAEAGAEN